MSVKADKVHWIHKKRWKKWSEGRRWQKALIHISVAMGAGFWCAFYCESHLRRNVQSGVICCLESGWNGKPNPWTVLGIRSRQYSNSFNGYSPAVYFPSFYLLSLFNAIVSISAVVSHINRCASNPHYSNYIKVSYSPYTVISMRAVSNENPTVAFIYSILSHKYWHVWFIFNIKQNMAAAKQQKKPPNKQFFRQIFRAHPLSSSGPIYFAPKGAQLSFRLQ